MSVMCFDSNALEMTKAEHCMYFTKFREFMLVHVVHTVLENLIIIKLRRLKSTKAGACIIQILQGLELEPALLKMKRTGTVSNRIINTVIVHFYR